MAALATSYSPNAVQTCSPNAVVVQCLVNFEKSAALPVSSELRDAIWTVRRLPCELQVFFQAFDNIVILICEACLYPNQPPHASGGVFRIACVPGTNVLFPRA